MLIHLEQYEIEMAYATGTDRAEALKATSPMYADIDMHTREKINIIGAMLELAYAKGLNKYWPAHGGLADERGVWKTMPDVDNMEVRASLKPHLGPKLRERDLEFAYSYETDTGRPLLLAGGYIDDHYNAHLFGTVPILNIWHANNHCCDVYRNDNLHGQMSMRVCKHHLTPLEVPQCH